MIKISDFCLSKNIIQIICNDLQVGFVDMPISFTNKDDRWFFSDMTLYAPCSEVKNQSLSKTLFTIVQVYIDNMVNINGGFLSPDQRDEILTYAYYLVYDFMNNRSDIEDDFSFISSLNVFPVSWIILKNIFSPIYGINLKDLPIKCGKTHEKDVISLIDSDQSPLFVNFSMTSKSVLEAYALYYGLKIYLPNQDTSDIIRSVFLDSSFKKRIIHFAELSFGHTEDFVTFFAVLSLLTNTEEISIMSEIHFAEQNIKTAQANPMGTWWYSGLIEKMLAPVRGPDWSVTKGLKSITDKLKKRVEKERKLRGLVDVPMEMLLRINSEDCDKEDKISLQKKLEEARIW